MGENEREEMAAEVVRIVFESLISYTYTQTEADNTTIAAFDGAVEDLTADLRTFQ